MANPGGVKEIESKEAESEHREAVAADEERLQQAPVIEQKAGSEAVKAEPSEIDRLYLNHNRPSLFDDSAYAWDIRRFRRPQRSAQNGSRIPQGTTRFL